MAQARTGAAVRPPTGVTGSLEVPWNLEVPTVEVYLVGYGNRLPNDFTLEMLAVLRRCGRVFGAPPIHAPEFGIPAMDSVMHLYRRGKKRSVTYEEIAELVLDAATTTPPVAFATYGSAVVGMPACHDILRRAPRRGLTTHVTNAVSCLDGIWADLDIEPLGGVEIWEAMTLVLLDVEPDPRANLLVPQVPLLDTGAPRAAVEVLRDHLLRFYPPDHRVHFVRTGAGAGPHQRAADPETVRLGDLAHPARERLSTLLVPPAAPHGHRDGSTASFRPTGDRQ